MSSSFWNWVTSFLQSKNTDKMAGEYQRWTVTEPYLNLHCGLGEGPYYESTTNSLRFVDIIKRRLHSVNLDQGPKSLKTIQFDQPIGVTADIEGVDPQEKILVGGKSGVYILDRKTEKLTLLKRFYDDLEEVRDQRLRSNDGAVDPQGRLWIGTMNDFWVGPPGPVGILFRFTSNLTRSSQKTSLTIPNGLGWTSDQKTLYFVHSTEKRILAYTYAATTGSISNERVFWEHESSGDPDGFVLDVEGNLWQAIYGESRVLKINPQGKVVGEITYPAEAITCPVFVGTELWVTSANQGDEEGVGGAVFRVDVGVGGLEKNKFKLDGGLGGF